MNMTNIKMYLFKHNIHQYQLAMKLNITETHLSKVMRGRVKPSRQLSAKIEAVLGEKNEDNRN